MTEYSEIRLKAKDLGIKNWHNKKLENLELEVAGVTGAQYANDLVDTLDKVEQVLQDKLQPVYDALDTLSSRYYEPLVATFDELMWNQRPSLGDVVQVQWLTQKIHTSCRKRYSPAAIRTFLGAVCKLNAHLGWAIDDDLLVLGPNKPLFNTRWQVDLWNHKSKDSNMITKLIAITQGA